MEGLMAHLMFWVLVVKDMRDEKILLEVIMKI
jgi:hypothetical protein